MTRRSSEKIRIAKSNAAPIRVPEVEAIGVTAVVHPDFTEKEPYERLKAGDSNGYFTYLGKRRGKGANHHLLVQCACGNNLWIWNSSYKQRSKTRCNECRRKALIDRPRLKVWRRMEKVGTVSGWTYSEFQELTDGINFGVYRNFGRWDHTKPHSPTNTYLCVARGPKHSVRAKLFRFGKFNLNQEEWGIIFGITGERVRQLRGDGATIPDLCARYGTTDPDDIKKAILDSVDGFPISE